MQQDSLLKVMAEDLAPWRDLPISRLLMAFLNEQETIYLEQIAHAVEEDRTPDARVLTGRLGQVRTILAALNPPERRQPEIDEPFNDPASIKRKTK